MILDPTGVPLKRTIGFIGGFVRVPRAQTLAGSLYVVGMEVPLIEDDEEDDAARTLERMRRA